MITALIDRIPKIILYIGILSVTLGTAGKIGFTLNLIEENAFHGHIRQITPILLISGISLIIISPIFYLISNFSHIQLKISKYHALRTKSKELPRNVSHLNEIETQVLLEALKSGSFRYTSPAGKRKSLTRDSDDSEIRNSITKLYRMGYIENRDTFLNANIDPASGLYEPTKAASMASRTIIEEINRLRSTL